MEYIQCIQDINRKKHKITYNKCQGEYIVKILYQCSNATADIKFNTYNRAIARDLFILQYRKLMKRIISNCTPDQKDLYNIKLTRIESCLLVTTIIANDYVVNNVGVILMQLEKQLNLKHYD